MLVRPWLHSFRNSFHSATPWALRRLLGYNLSGFQPFRFEPRYLGCYAETGQCAADSLQDHFRSRRSRKMIVADKVMETQRK